MNKSYPAFRLGRTLLLGAPNYASSNAQFQQQRGTHCLKCLSVNCTDKVLFSGIIKLRAGSKTLSTTAAAGQRLILSEKRYEEGNDAEFSNSVQESDNLITVPIHLKNRLEKKLVLEGSRGKRREKIVNASRTGRKTHILIQCKRHEFNHYFGGTYAKNGEIPLASKSWNHRKSPGDWFIIKNSQHVENAGFAGVQSTFEELGVKPNIVEKLLANNAKKPTVIQELAIPKILEGRHNLIAAETGCGKTLAYLVPVVQQILDEKRRRRTRAVNEPLSIILLPSRELADQIYYVASKLTEGLGIDVSILQGGNIGSKIANASAKPIDLLIATLNAVKTLTSAGVFKMNKTQHIVLDEADTLLDDSFNTDIIDFLHRFEFNPLATRVTQLTLCSATLPRSVESIMADVVPVDSLNRISTPGLHYVMSHVPQTFLRIKKIDKPTKLLEIVQADLKAKVPLMIFCNRTIVCDWMHIFLRDNGIKAVCVHGETKPTRRQGLLNLYQEGKSDILICTDLGSRGINTVRTGHVLNYEFPSFLADYVHRCGRTGRLGATQKGRVTNFISRPIEVDVVHEIEKSVRKEESMFRVNGNIKRLLNAKYGNFKQIVPVDTDSPD